MGTLAWGLARHLDLTTVGKLPKAGCYDVFRRGDAGDDRAIFVLLSHRDGAHRRRSVSLHNVHERPVGTPLDRGARDRNGPAQGVDQQPYVDELPRPELQVDVRKFSFELHRASRRIDLIVDHLEGTTVEYDFAVRRRRFRRERSRANAAPSTTA